MINAVFPNHDLVFANEDSDNVTLFIDEVSLNTIYHNDITLANSNFDNYDLETTINLRLMDCCDRCKQRKA